MRPLAELTYREKSLYWNLVPNVVVLLLLVWTMVFTTYDPHRFPAAIIACVTISYFGTLGESIYTMYFAADTRTDERDKTIKGRGTAAAYAVLSGGIFLTIWFSGSFELDRSPRFLMWLFVVWIVSRIVKDLTELRCHAGHEGLWPDAVVANIRGRSRRRFDAQMAAIRARNGEGEEQ